MKLFVQEQHSASMQAAFQSASLVAVSQITWVEMCAALALKQRTRQMDAPQAAQALQDDGPNELPGASHRGLLAIARETLSDPMFALLLAAGVL